MSAPRLRLLPYAIADGPHNMAADEAMLLSAEQGVASLRFYGWSPATLSLGYFQPAAARLTDDRLAALPWVRRPSGGATLVHDAELTYALTLPPGPPWQSGESWMPRMHANLAAALVCLAPRAKIAAAAAGSHRGEILCFQMTTPGDLVCDEHKVVGSAQRKHRRCLLQHGSILLRQSDATPAVPGLQETAGVVLGPRELSEAIVSQLAGATGWTIDRNDWTLEERGCIDRLVREKYGHPTWNAKR